MTPEQKAKWAEKLKDFMQEFDEDSESNEAYETWSKLDDIRHELEDE